MVGIKGDEDETRKEKMGEWALRKGDGGSQLTKALDFRNGSGR